MKVKTKPVPPAVTAGLLASRKLARHQARKHADQHTLLTLWHELSPTERRRTRRTKRVRRGIGGIAVAALIAAAAGLAIRFRPGPHEAGGVR